MREWDWIQEGAELLSRCPNIPCVVIGLRRIVAVDRGGSIKQRCKQVLLDVSDLCCILTQTTDHILDMPVVSNDNDPIT